MSLVIGGPLVARRCEVPAKRSHRASSRRLRVHHCCQMLQGEEQPLLGRDPPILGSQLRHRAALMLRLPRSWRTCSAPRSSTWAALRLSEICSLASGCTAGRAGQGFRRPLLPPLRCHSSSVIKSRSEEIQQFFAQEQDLFKIQCVNILLISNNKIYQQYQNPPQSCARHENRGRNSGL